MYLLIELKFDERYHQKPAVFKISHGRLELVRGGDWLPETWLEEKLSKRPKIGVEQFVGTANGEAIVRSLIEVMPTEPHYLEAWREEFEREGFYAAIVDEKKANIWENIRNSGFDYDIQDEVVFKISALSDEQAEKIRKELENLSGKSLSK